MILPFNPKVPQENYLPIDLSVNNSELESIDIYSPKEMEAFIQNKLDKNDMKYAFGGYLEKRNIYKKSGHFTAEKERDIHLGIDFWAGEEEPVYCPMDGVVHSFQNNTLPGDYGPTIVLEHYEKNNRIYSLYGHLSLASLSGLKKGKTIKKGECFCYLGGPEVNGGYAPHLHFQLIRDLENKTGDYPGVCAASQLNFYQNNCPDPLIFMNFSL